MSNYMDKKFSRTSSVRMFADETGSGDKGASPFFDFKAKKLDGTEVELRDLCWGATAIIVVNVASKWGVTKRDYEQLVQMYKDFGDKGLKIIGFPCN